MLKQQIDHSGNNGIICVCVDYTQFKELAKKQFKVSLLLLQSGPQDIWKVHQMLLDLINNHILTVLYSINVQL